MTALRELSVTPELILAIREKAAFNPLVYLPEESEAKIEQELLHYLVEHFYLLELVDYKPDFSIHQKMSQKTERHRLEKKIWQELDAKRVDAPVGSIFFLQSPRSDKDGYPEEVWFFGVRQEEGSWQGWQLQLQNLKAEDPPIPLEKYVAIYQKLSGQKLSPGPTEAEILTHFLVFEPGNDLRNILQAVTQVLADQEVGGLKIEPPDLSRLILALEQRPAEKIRQGLKQDPKIAEQISLVQRAVKLADPELSVWRVIMLEEEIARRFGHLPPNSGCGIACSLLAQSTSRGEAGTATGGTGETRDIQLVAKFCPDCKKRRPCDCQKA